MRHFIASLLVLMFIPTITLAENSDKIANSSGGFPPTVKVGANPPSVVVFSRSLNKVWAASLEDTPFQSIRSEVIPEMNAWGTTVQLFDSHECRLNKSGDMQDHWMYYCVIKLWDSSASLVRSRKGIDAFQESWMERVKPIYVNLTNLVQASRADWAVSPVPFLDAAVRFTNKNDVLKGNAMPRSIEIRLEHSAIVLLIKPPHK